MVFFSLLFCHFSIKKHKCELFCPFTTRDFHKASITTSSNGRCSLTKRPFIGFWKTFSYTHSASHKRCQYHDQTMCGQSGQNLGSHLYVGFDVGGLWLSSRLPSWHARCDQDLVSQLQILSRKGPCVPFVPAYS